MARWGGTRHLIRGFEGDRDRSAGLSVAIAEAHRRLGVWTATIEMRFSGACDEDVAYHRMYKGYVCPVAATGRGVSDGEIHLEQLTSLDEPEKVCLTQTMMPVFLAEQLHLTCPQANAAALRLAAHRLAAPEAYAADLTTGSNVARPSSTCYFVARWIVDIRAVSKQQARAIAELLATTLVDHTGSPRGYVVDLKRLRHSAYDDPPSEWDPDDLIAEIADHAANVAALRAPMLMASALLMRAWIVEANEHEFAIGQHVRDVLGNPGRSMASQEELNDAELRARLIARGRSPAELHELSRQISHVGHQYLKFWPASLDDRRRLALTHHECEVLRKIARESDPAEEGPRP